MFRKIGFGAAAALTVGMLAVGCSEDGDTIVSGGGVTRTGNFPGSQVDDNNVAADGRAFTPAGSEFEEGFHVFWNRANNEAIVLFEVEDPSNGTFRLYASHYRAGRMSAPVQIRGNGNGAVEDAFSSVAGMKVVWLNTSGTIADKNGDAIILFTRNDQDLTTNPGNTSNEDSNRRLWMAYFNSSDVNAAPSGTTINGFQTSAVAIDTDIISTGADTDIGTFGVVSDSLHNSHTFTAGTDFVNSGDPTSYVYVFYGKDTTTGANASPRFRFLALDLTATTLPAAGGTDLALGAGSYDTNEGADINGNVVVHNNAMLWNSTSVGTPASGDDTVVTVTFFNTTGTGVGVASTLNEALTANFDSATMPSAGNVYGDDNGLAKLVVFYQGSGYTDNAVGARAGDTDAMIATFSLDSATAPTVERAEIDNFQDVVSATISGARGNVAEIQTRISRPGNYILALMRGDNTNLTDGTAPQLHDRLYARVYQTQLAGATTNRTLANSLSTVLTPPALAASNAQGQAGVTGVRFQEDLADGRGDRSCSFQGNHRRMNFLYQQLGDQASATTADENRLLVNGVTVTLDATGTAVPTVALVSGSEVEVDRVDTGWLANYSAARAFDAGDATTTGNPPAPTTTAGRVIVVFLSQENNRLDDGATGAFAERRLYAWESGTQVTLSTNPTDTAVDFFQAQNFLEGVVTPVNENTQQTPDHVGTRLDIFWTEEENPTSVGTATNELDLGTRSYDLKTTAGTTTVAIADRFTPPTSAEASFIDDRSDSLLLTGNNIRSGGVIQGSPLDGGVGYEGFTTLRRGSTVGVIFDQANRIRYQETSTDGAGYYKSGNDFRPELVDNESDRSVLDYQVDTRPRCEDMADAMIFFLKMTDNAIDTTPRAQVRIKR